MTVYAEVPLDKVQPHPNNVRRAAVADDDMVASVVAGGIHEPVLLGPETADGIRYLIAGNRRYDAAVKAGLTELPALLRDDLVTEQQQLEVMLVENLHRSDLTVIEEADAYEQLQLFGMDAKAIAAATGRSVATVKQRLTLGGLSVAVKESVHTGAATLGDALTLLEFADDPEAEAGLAQFLGHPDFAWKARNLKNARARAARVAGLVAGFAERGIPEWDRGANPSGQELSRLRYSHPHLSEEAAHDGCLVWFETTYSDPGLACINLESHALANLSPGEQAQAAAEAAEREAALELADQRRAAVAAARSVRLEILRDLATQALPAKGKAADALAGLLTAALPSLLAEGDFYGLTSHGVIDEALGLEGTWTEKQEQATGMAATLLAGPRVALLDTLARILAALIEDNLSKLRRVRSGHPDTRPHAAAAWEWLEGTGYLLSTVDEQVRAEVTAADDAEGDA